MCDAVQFNLSDFTNSQTEQLQNFTTSDGLVTFRHKGKPQLIPFLFSHNLELVRWAGTYPLPLLEDGGMSHLRPKPVFIPAEFAITNGVRYKVAPSQIKGIIVKDRQGSLIYILVRPSSDYFHEMTKSEWEPVYNGEHLYHNALS
ncbi:hypothetical protein [Gimesia fumaroli]|uniref:Uncharacterized protein n=1 Tax=Gimesia fumaroli TaxID=2527976 RepID=A0A518I8X0_9PLAN|nr:hypothetical protein [Gimesia fumaroli]QDV49568.1 hypothetical protein Enr17x_15880 [Gimesia fumaroli]